MSTNAPVTEAHKKLFALICTAPSEEIAYSLIAGFEQSVVADALLLKSEADGKVIADLTDKLATAQAEQVKVELALVGLFDPNGPGDCGDRLVAGIQKLRQPVEAKGSASGQVARLKAALTRIVEHSGGVYGIASDALAREMQE